VNQTVYDVFINIYCVVTALCSVRGKRLHAQSVSNDAGQHNDAQLWMVHGLAGCTFCVENMYLPCAVPAGGQNTRSVPRGQRPLQGAGVLQPAQLFVGVPWNTRKLLHLQQQLHLRRLSLISQPLYLLSKK
jgi:hypothetical protein